MNKKVVSLLMVICMFMVVLSGCGSKAVSTDVKPENKEIKLTDMLGREVTLKNGVAKKVVANKCTLRLYTYVGRPENIVGIEKLEKGDSVGKPYMMANESLKDRPIIGQGGSSNADDYEKILAVKPDVIFTGEKDKATVDKLQEKVGIPIVALSYGKGSTFDPDLYSSLKLIGKVMGEDKRANEVVDYMEKCKKDLSDRTKDVPDDKKPSAYVGCISHAGSHGIESTRGKYPLFSAVHAKNVADETEKMGIIMIDKEKLLEWNPDKVFIDLGGIQMVQEDYKKNPKLYKTLSAFKNSDVYSILPSVWYGTNVDTSMCDAYYIGKVLYPEQFKDIEPDKKADEIYKTLLGKELYSQVAKDYYGGFQKITLDELEKMGK